MVIIGMVMMVRKERLELSQVTPLEPKSSASTNSATFANNVGLLITIAALQRFRVNLKNKTT